MAKQKLLALAELSAMSFTDLKKYADQFGVKDNSKSGLLHELQEGGHVAADAPAPEAQERKEPEMDVVTNKTFWRFSFNRAVAKWDGGTILPNETVRCDNRDVAYNVRGSTFLLKWEEVSLQGKKEVVVKTIKGQGAVD